MSTAGGERSARLAATRIMLVAGSASGGPDWLGAARRALATGLVGALQLREKALDDAGFLAAADAVRAACAAHGVLLLLNDRVALAATCDADGAHVGEEDLPPRMARMLLGADRLLGLSTHDAAEVRAAARLPVDYVGLGPCHATDTKRLARAPGGPALVEAAVRESGTLPLFPIGGVTPENAPALVAAGARRFAVGAGVLRAPDAARAVEALARALEAAPR